MVNGTKGLIESLFQIDESAQRIVKKLIRDAIECSEPTFLDNPTDCITMSLKDRKTHKPRSKYTLPADFILIQDENNDMVTIPVGYEQNGNVLEVGSSKTHIFYHGHPLELGIGFADWKL